MGALSALVFSAPAVLAALAALPVLWWLLRVTPPRPRRVPFPPLRIVMDMIPERQTPSRTPWWLLALRLAIAGLAILAAAGPVWQPDALPATGSRGPMLLVIDNSATAAHDWPDRVRLAGARIDAAARAGRAVALVATADAPGEIAPLSPAAAQERLQALEPAPFVASRDAHAATVAAFLQAQPAAEPVFITDRVRVAAQEDGGALASALRARTGIVHAAPSATPLALVEVANRADGLFARIVRAEPNGREGATIIASDARGLPLARAEARFAPGATETEARFDLPLELRNAVARAEIEGERSAAAVTLVDERSRRRRVGVVSGASADLAQPLLSPTYYVSRALAPFADVREGRGGASEAVSRLLEENASVIVLADVGALDRDVTERLTRFVEEGGMLIRFAGTRLAAGGDELIPVRLRRGGRSLGGSLSWDSPKTIATFTPNGPFASLRPTREVVVRRQILAEPDAQITQRTWAALDDGTPIVTGERRGQGHIALFHMTADPSWSNLPLSGLFVDMLRELVNLSGRAVPGGERADAQAPPLSPRVILDGFGTAGSPPATAKPAPRNFAARAGADHPAGLYGPADGSLAVNVLLPADRLAPLDLAPFGGTVAPIVAGTSVDLRGPALAAALGLLVVDTLLLALMGGLGAGALSRRRRAAAATLLLLGGAGLALAPLLPALAQEAGQAQPRPPIRKEDVQAAFQTRLAYIVTGDAQTDAASRAGLQGLTAALAVRTAFEPGDPIGVDPARDELSVYPLIYWPVVVGRPLPTDAALRRIDAFMKGGGTIVFDTRDAPSTRPGGEPTPATLQLRRMLATLDIPELETLPRDHVLTKAFYLIDELPGRHATGRTWIEALPPVPDGEERPARSGDGISPIVITGNDLAAAWAVDRDGNPIYPVSGTERQREMALRGGINLVMYALTGNYKTDQVHVGPLLERLGQ